MVSIRTIDENLVAALRDMETTNYGRAHQTIIKTLTALRESGVTCGVTIDEIAFQELVRAAKRE